MWIKSSFFFVYLISQNKLPRVNILLFYEKFLRWSREKILYFFLFLGRKFQKICIHKRWVDNPIPLLDRVGLFVRASFISRDKILDPRHTTNPSHLRKFWVQKVIHINFWIFLKKSINTSKLFFSYVQYIWGDIIHGKYVQILI